MWDPTLESGLLLTGKPTAGSKAPSPAISPRALPRSIKAIVIGHRFNVVNIWVNPDNYLDSCPQDKIKFDHPNSNVVF